MPLSPVDQFVSRPANRSFAIQGAFLFALAALSGTTAVAQSGLIVYPSQGQSMEQQASDESACGTWARQQTGFDPARGPQYQAGNSSGGEIIGGTAKGATLGLVGGLIAGDAGKGAAIGAGVGATAGLMRKNRNRRENNQAQQQAANDYNRQVETYNRAFASCMQGRGYSVN